MDLQEFVASTLTQISAGIAQAQEQCAESGAWINPTGALAHPKEKLQVEVDLNARAYLEQVQFDVAVTIGSDQTAEGGGGIRVLGLDLGAKGSVNYENSTVSRIRFSVPVVWPADRDPELEQKRTERAARQSASTPRRSSWVDSRRGR